MNRNHNSPRKVEIRRFLGFYYLGGATISQPRQIAGLALKALLNHILNPHYKND